MLATNPVDVHQIRRIEMLGPAGPHSEWPRSSNDAPFPVAKFLGVSALVVAGYVVLGTLGANAAGPASNPVEPVAKAPAAREIRMPVATPVPGDFRLAPGNDQPQGVVVRLGVPKPFPGDFRLAPGNNQPQGLVPAR